MLKTDVCAQTGQTGYVRKRQFYGYTLVGGVDDIQSVI